MPMHLRANRSSWTLSQPRLRKLRSKYKRGEEEIRKVFLVNANRAKSQRRIEPALVSTVREHAKLKKLSSHDTLWHARAGLSFASYRDS